MAMPLVGGYLPRRRAHRERRWTPDTNGSRSALDAGGNDRPSIRVRGNGRHKYQSKPLYTHYSISVYLEAKLTSSLDRGCSVSPIPNAEWRPSLIRGVERVDFTPGIRLLRHPTSGTVLKLTPLQADIVGRMDGARTFGDLVGMQVEREGTGSLGAIVELLDLLTSHGFLVRSDNAPLGPGRGNRRAPAGRGRVVGSIRARTFRGLSRLPAAPWIPAAMLAVCAAAFLIKPTLIPPGIAGLLGEASGFAVAYLGAAVSLWAIACLILSVRNVFSACVVAGCTGARVRISLCCLWGLVFFSDDDRAVVRAGPRATAGLYLIRTGLLWAVACLAGILFSVLPWIGFGLVAVAGVAAGLISLCPLVESDLTRALYFLVPQAGTPVQARGFVRKRFLSSLFSLKKTGRGENYRLVIGLAAVVWMYLFYLFFWRLIEADAAGVVAGIVEGSWGLRVAALLYLLLLITPPVAILAGGAAGLFTNLGTAVRPSSYRLRRAASRVLSRNVPVREEIVEFLSHIPLFSPLSPEELRRLCAELRLRTFRRGGDVVVEGERGSRFYVIVRGSASVLKENPDGTFRTVETLGVGDCFGEIALISRDMRRTATVRAREKVVVFELDKPAFETFIASTGRGRERITEMIRIGKLLRETEAFAFLTPRQTGALIPVLKTHELEPGDTVFCQGEQGDRIYLIREGTVEVRRMEKGTTVLRTRLGKGRVVGEIALVRNTVRTATVVALDRVRLLSLDREELARVVRENVYTGIGLETIVQSRLAGLSPEVLKA